MSDILEKLFISKRKIQIDDTPVFEDDIDDEDDELEGYIEPLNNYTLPTVDSGEGWMPDGEWRGYFPMPEFREWQETTIESIIKGWRSGKKYAIVEGPTGSGKSSWALAIGRYFNNTFIATPQKMLQNQYMKDFSQYLFELKGRANYPCLRINHELWRDETGEVEMRNGKKHKVTTDRVPNINSDFITLEEFNKLDKDHPFRQYNCANAPCNKIKRGDEMKAECKKHGVCEYIRRRDYALHVSNFTLMNFSNLILFSLLMPGVYRKRSLLILDEGHTLENYLYSYATISVGVKQLKHAAEHFNDIEDYERITKPFKTTEEFVEYIRDTVIPACESYDKAAKILEKKGVEDAIEDEELSKKDEFISDLFSKDERKKLKVLVKKLKEFLSEEPTSHSHVIVTEKTLEGMDDVVTGVKIRPFSVAKLGPSLAFSPSISRVLIMSATILDPATFCKSIGIPSDEAFFIRVPSTFPPENRQIIGDLTVGSMSYKNKEKTLPIMLDRILELTERHEIHKGIIHTGNYEFMHKLKKWAKTNPVLRERLLCQSIGTFEEKERLIKLHTTTSEPTILCGPGFMEGIDLKDDLARFNIIMKIPYMSLADLLIKRKAEEFPEWYDLQTALALIQAIGRTVRSRDDWAVVYILDLLWKYFYTKNKNRLFPKYIQDAVRWIDKRNPIPYA